jgi:hypothetical protein
VVTYEFSSEADQTAFKSAIDGDLGSNTDVYEPATDTDLVEHFKTEWFAQDGSTISNTTNL